jgi:hypothetical protein
MAKAKKANQLSFETPDKTGLLSVITGVIAGAKVDLSAICAYTMGEKAYIMLNADSVAKAKKALAGLGVSADESDVMVVEMHNKPGELHRVAKKIADAGVNIEYMYATAGTGRSSTCIFSTSDNKKAIKAINK